MEIGLDCGFEYTGNRSAVCCAKTDNERNRLQDEFDQIQSENMINNLKLAE
jgi:hypothetical protein